MSTHRGAVIAFHNRIGFAFRRLKREHKLLAAELLPASKVLRQKVSHAIAEHPPTRIDTSWPSWQGKQVDSETVSLHAGSLTKRKLEIHNTDSTMPPEDSCSVTEAWPDSSSFGGSARSGKHSRKPRRGRRAKARAHSKLFEDTRAQCLQFESAALGESNWTSTLGTLLECMEEDMYGDCSASAVLAHSGGNADQEIDVQSLLSDPEETCPDGTHFEVRLYKGGMVSLGLSVNQTADGEALHISSVLPDGLVDSWNAKCSKESQIHNGDRIVRVNACSNFEDMMGEITKIGDKILEVVRGPFPTPQPVAVASPAASPRVMEHKSIPVSAAPTCRRRRDERAFDVGMDRCDLQTLLARRLAESRSGR